MRGEGVGLVGSWLGATEGKKGKGQSAVSIAKIVA